MVLLLFFFTISTFVRAAFLDRYHVKEIHNVPDAWSKGKPALTSHVMTIHIALKQGRFDELEQRLWEISDPDHGNYGQHLSTEQVDELIAPPAKGLESVLLWLQESGVAIDAIRFSRAKDFISVDLPIGHIQDLLQTKYHYYTNKEGESLIRTPSWSLPRHLHQFVDTIQPTNNFMRPHAQSKARNDRVPTNPHDETTIRRRSNGLHSRDGYPDVSKACRNASWVEPTCISTLYGTVDYKLRAGTKNSISLNNYDGQLQARVDLRQYLKKYRPDALPGADKFRNILIDGGPASQENFTKQQVKDALGAEGNLDANLIIGLTYPTPLTIYSTGGQPPFLPDAFSSTNGNEPFLPWLNHVLAQSDSDLPLVVSTSYADDEHSVPYSYAKKVCELYAQLGARGVSAIQSTGDFGVGPNGTCISNDGKKKKQFIPAFPASCPYVTSVGGTSFDQFGPSPGFEFTRGSLPEVVANQPMLYTTGGGFSNYFRRPAYQSRAVPKYVESLNGLWQGYYNSSGRGYPDVAAISTGIATVWNGYLYQTGGTSASTPIFASVVALLNDARLAAGKRPLGFLNPLLYRLSGRGFHDVTKGSNAGCSEIGDGSGFPAKKGWDAATGFGSPDFKLLKELVAGCK